MNCFPLVKPIGILYHSISLDCAKQSFEREGNMKKGNRSVFLAAMLISHFCLPARIMVKSDNGYLQNRIY